MNICRTFLQAAREVARRDGRPTDVDCAILGDAFGYILETPTGQQIDVGRAHCAYCARAEAISKIEPAAAPAAPASVTAYYVKTDGTGRHPADLIIGVVVFKTHHDGSGWMFMPWNQSKNSRRLWPTPEAALRGRVSNYKLEPRSIAP